ncbi:hypothetical protein ABPG74_019221 [Tetrahymena malaccensis]
MKKNLVLLVFTCAILISFIECQKKLRQGKMQQSYQLDQSVANSFLEEDQPPTNQLAQKKIQVFRKLFNKNMQECFDQCTRQFNNVYFFYNYGLYGCCQFELGPEMMGSKYQPINCGLQTIYC